MALKIRRGLESQRGGITFASGEMIWTTNAHKLYVGDGVTPGGIDIASQLGGLGLTYNNGTGKLDVDLGSTTTDTLPEGNNNKYFTVNTAIAAAGSGLVAGNTHNTGITFAYDDVNHRITAIVDGGGLPSQSGQNGKFLSTNGTSANWTALTTHLNADTSPALGGNLTLSSYDITGTGNINITGTMAGTIRTTGNFLTYYGATTTGVGGSDVSVKIAKYSGVTPVTVEDTDILHSYHVEGYNGSIYQKASVLQTSVSSALSIGNFKATTGLYVADGQGGYNSFTFDGSGVFGVAAISMTPLPQSVINVVPPANGGFVYNSTVSSLQLYTGSEYGNVLTTKVTPPVAANSSGHVGQVAWDSTYMYLCTAANTWIRSPITAW